MNIQIRNSKLDLGNFKSLCPMCGRETLQYKKMTGFMHCKGCGEEWRCNK